jgi:hypothetical protein
MNYCFCSKVISVNNGECLEREKLKNPEWDEKRSLDLVPPSRSTFFIVETHSENFKWKISIFAHTESGSKSQGGKMNGEFHSYFLDILHNLIRWKLNTLRKMIQK